MKMLHEPGTNGPPFRVLFYGQSITLQYWWAELAQWLRTNFPNRNLEITNLALPGFTSEYLHRAAEADLYPHYPDLLIFQNYGAAEYYTKMIRNVRRRTTADIIIQTDHPTQDSELSEPTTREELPWQQPYNAWRNYVFLPDLARQVSAELADIRSGWKNHLAIHHLSTSNLLADHIHLNRQGEILMRELLKAHFRLISGSSSDTWSNAFRTINLANSALWSNGVLRVPFHGNRIDLTCERVTAPVQARIDGRKPSELPELFHFGRADLYPNSPWPFVIGLSSRKPLVEEIWTLKVLDFGASQGRACALQFQAQKRDTTAKALRPTSLCQTQEGSSLNRKTG